MSDSPPQNTSKKLEAKRARRLAEERKAAEQKKAQRKRSLITMGLAVGVGVLVVLLIISQRDPGKKDSVDIDGPDTPAAAKCTKMQTYPEEGHTHVPEGTPVHYKTDPPTSGNHWPPESIAAPGFYATPVDSERLVHNLEHGNIVIWYKNDAPQETKDKIEQYVGNDPYVIAVPYDFTGPGEYAMSAWKVSQACEIPSQTMLDDFRVANQGHGREAFTPPFTK